MLIERYVLVLAAALLAAGPAHGQGQVGQTEIELRGANPIRRSYWDEIDFGRGDYSPYRDNGELLREVPGVSAGRMGGHGIEPVIRGQSQTQLNVSSDGSYTFGACPNRMDPPTSYALAGDDAVVRIERGYQSVARGPGGPGGSISIEHKRPRALPDKPVSGVVSGRYGSNGDLASGAAALVYSESQAYVSGQGFFQDSGNYRDGDGDLVRSAATSYGGALSGGALMGPGTEVKLGVERVSIDDALYAGAGMDAPRSNSTLVRLGVDHDVECDVRQSIRFSAFGSLVDHLMDNYSLRERTAGFMRAPSDSNTYGGRIVYELAPKGHELKAGLDLLNNNKTARAYMNMTDRDSVSTLQTLLWPDVTVGDLGLFVEDRLEFGAGTAITAGLRYDHVESVIKDEDLRPGSSAAKAAGMSSAVLPSPQELYRRYYGVSAEDRSEDNWGGIARIEQELAGNLSLYAKYARVVRTADATERAISRSMGTENWIGNPALDPESHSEAELGAFFSGKRWNSFLAVYNDSIQNYILRDRARGQEGVLQSDGATIYRNIEARIAGAESGADLSLTENWRIGAAGFYTWGQDRDRGSALPQIPPLQGSLKLFHLREQWRAGLTLRAASRQGRVDADPERGTGRDVRKTPGWAALDLMASFKISPTGELRFGVLNILDKSYADHLNRSNLFDPEEIQVNEPGREFFVQLAVRL